MTLAALAGETRIHTLPNRPPFMLIREIAEISGLKADSLSKQFRRHQDEFPIRYFFVLTPGEYLEKFGQIVRTSQGSRTDLGKIALTEKGAILLLSFVAKKEGRAALLNLVETLFAERDMREEALRSALVEDEAKFIGRSTIKATIKLAAIEGWSFSRLAAEVNCSMPVLIKHIQAMRLRGYIPQEAVLPPVYLLREIAEKKAKKAAFLDAHEHDARQLLLGLEG